MNGFYSLGTLILVSLFSFSCAQKSSKYITTDRPFYEQPEQDIQETIQGLFQQELEVKGVANGFGSLKKDGYIDFSMVLPAIARADLVQMEFTSIISPYTDTLKLPVGAAPRGSQ